MFIYELFESDSLYGMKYTFPAIGDGLRLHDHETEQEHNIMVLKGSIDMYGYGWTETFVAGDVFAPIRPDHYPHEIVALEPNTILVGMFLHGKPEGEDIPLDERAGSMHRPLVGSHIINEEQP
jgi:hypothetical protein